MQSKVIRVSGHITEFISRRLPALIHGHDWLHVVITSVKRPMPRRLQKPERITPTLFISEPGRHHESILGMGNPFLADDPKGENLLVISYAGMRGVDRVESAFHAIRQTVPAAALVMLPCCHYGGGSESWDPRWASEMGADIVQANCKPREGEDALLMLRETIVRQWTRSDPAKAPRSAASLVAAG